MLTVVVVGHAERCVDQQTWRSRVSRVEFRASVGPPDVSPQAASALQPGKAGFHLIDNGEASFHQSVGHTGLFTLRSDGDAVRVRFDDAGSQGVPRRSARDLSPIVVGRCYEIAANYKVVSDVFGDARYCDRVWRLWWPHDLDDVADWPTPDRVFDLREVLY